MRIAVCLSGQMRTWSTCYPNIMRYFGEADYFISTWDDEPDIDSMVSVYRPKSIVRESLEAIGSFSSSRKPLIHNMKTSLREKLRYEIEHDFRYDVVVKARFDIAFNPATSFSPIIKPLTISSAWEPDRILVEHNHLEMTDILFYGDSLTIDIMADVRDNIEPRLGAGALLYRHAFNRNIAIRCPNHICLAIVRDSARDLNPNTDFKTIMAIHRAHYAKSVKADWKADTLLVNCVPIPV